MFTELLAVVITNLLLIVIGVIFLFIIHVNDKKVHSVLEQSGYKLEINNDLFFVHIDHGTCMLLQ